jgi:hypothetical protein
MVHGAWHLRFLVVVVVCTFVVHTKTTKVLNTESQTLRHLQENNQDVCPPEPQLLLAALKARNFQ